MSAVEITSSGLCENGAPIKGGLLDPAMGVIDRHLKCQTCGGNKDTCPGHFGHLELTKPMFHIGFLDVVMKTLRCVCLHCAAPLFHRQDPAVVQALAKRNPDHRLAAMVEICSKVKACGQRVARVGVISSSFHPNCPLSLFFCLQDPEQANGDVPMMEQMGCGHVTPRAIRKEQLSVNLHYHNGAGNKDRTVCPCVRWVHLC